LNRLKLLFLAFITFSCNRWDYEDPSVSIPKEYPETYISIFSSDTIFISEDSLGLTIFNIEDSLESDMIWDTLPNAFTTITTSKQKIHWWGEDPDGNVEGYFYKWSSDTGWSYTDLESGVFYVPIRTDLDIFSFEVKAVDNDSLIDQTPSKITLPIKNSSPTISFRYLSNPLIADIPGDTNFTFPTRTFVWDLYDQDGNETITDVFYSLDDTCNSCWNKMPGDLTSITLTELAEGSHVFYVKCQDIAGAFSPIIQFPDSLRPSEVQNWKVKPVKGDVLIVDDYPLDNANNALNWYTGMMDTLLGDESYSFWEVGDELPYSSTDIAANLNYFKHVVWYTAYNNTASANDTYNRAEANLVNFIMNGGNLFINPIDFEDTTFTWFPLDSVRTLNPNGRLYTGKVIESPLDTSLNLSVSHLIAVKVKSFWPKASSFEMITELYHMADPTGNDNWNGNPTVGSIGQYKVSPTELSGKVVILTLPLHDGYRPKLQGNGSAIKLFKYLFEDQFLE
tara:strand:+ start:1421 stop:2944 length:1524 start_codon:yes stop_codon:yes gene_type:complete